MVMRVREAVGEAEGEPVCASMSSRLSLNYGITAMGMKTGEVGERRVSEGMSGVRHEVLE